MKRAVPTLKRKARRSVATMRATAARRRLEAAALELEAQALEKAAATLDSALEPSRVLRATLAPRRRPRKPRPN
jgi:hypothetical protein